MILIDDNLFLHQSQFTPAFNVLAIFLPKIFPTKTNLYDLIFLLCMTFCFLVNLKKPAQHKLKCFEQISLFEILFSMNFTFCHRNYERAGSRRKNLNIFNFLCIFSKYRGVRCKSSPPPVRDQVPNVDFWIFQNSATKDNFCSDAVNTPPSG